MTKPNASSVPVPPSCEHCTLLTGLEIDAAKNGKHPNLDPILKDQTHQNSYLTFLKKWKQLRSEENYYFSNLTFKNSKSSNEEKFTQRIVGQTQLFLFQIMEPVLTNCLAVLEMNWKNTKRKKKSAIIP